MFNSLIVNRLGMSQQNILSVKGSCNGITWEEVFGAVLKPYTRLYSY